MYIFLPRVVIFTFLAVVSLIYTSPENSAFTSPVLEIIAQAFVSSLVPSALSRPFTLISLIAKISIPC